MSSSTKNTTAPAISLQPYTASPQAIAPTLPVLPLPSNTTSASDSSLVSAVSIPTDVRNRKRKAPDDNKTTSVTMKRMKIVEGDKIGILVTDDNEVIPVYQDEPIVISLRQADVNCLKEEATNLSTFIQDSGNNLDDNLSRLGNTLRMIGQHNKIIQDKKDMATIAVKVESTKTIQSATLFPGISQLLYKDTHTMYIMWCPMLRKCQDPPKITKDVTKTVKTMDIATANAYQWGIGTDVDQKEALRLCKIRADDGNPGSQMTLGDCYNQGTHGVDKDEQKALEYYNLSANQGHHQSNIKLGRIYQSGNTVVDKNPIRAFSYFQKAAHSKDGVGQYHLAQCYFYGIGVEQDIKEAVRLYKLSAQKGCMHSATCLAFCYLKGDGVQQDLARGFHFLRVAATNGNICAQTNLGKCYESGKGCMQSLKRARYW
jgi:TPR repeat protein